MIHFSELTNILLKYFTSIDLTEREQYFILINVYGQLTIYQRSIGDLECYESDLERAPLCGPWVVDVRSPEEDFYMAGWISKCLASEAPVVKNVWLIERFMQNHYWRYEPIVEPRMSDPRIISFYSYKGGTGRTTALLLTAISMALGGKKVVLIDFDLEAAGLFQFFPERQLPKYGLLDYLVESYPYDMDSSAIRLEDYLHPLTDLCGAEQLGGNLYIVAACGTELLSRPEDHTRALMHMNLDIGPFHQDSITPIDHFLSIVQDQVKPDYILIDSRSGIHQIAGITMNRYSNLALLFFTANRSNAVGMKLVIPALKAYNTPYMLIHARVPKDESVAEKKRQYYLKGAYDAIRCADEAYPNGTVLDDLHGEHRPFELPERPELAHVSKLQDLLDVYPIVKEEYEILSKEIMRRV